MGYLYRPQYGPALAPQQEEKNDAMKPMKSCALALYMDHLEALYWMPKNLRFTDSSPYHRFRHSSPERSENTFKTLLFSHNKQNKDKNKHNNRQ